jgi:hypothetical protein
MGPFTLRDIAFAIFLVGAFGLILDSWLRLNVKISGPIQRTAADKTEDFIAIILFILLALLVIANRYLPWPKYVWMFPWGPAGLFRALCGYRFMKRHSASVPEKNLR